MPSDDIAPVLTLADDPPPAQDQLTQLPLEQLRTRRQALREEEERARRWQRLLQARLDLAVDSVDPVPELGGGFPVLRPVIGSAVVLDVVDDLRRVDVARRELQEHVARVREELERTTAELVARYRLEPGLCLGRGAGRDAVS